MWLSLHNVGSHLDLSTHEFPDQLQRPSKETYICEMKHFGTERFISVIMVVVVVVVVVVINILLVPESENVTLKFSSIKGKGRGKPQPTG